MKETVIVIGSGIVARSLSATLSWLGDEVVNIDWLLTGDGEPYKNAVVVDPKTRDEIEREYIQSVFESLPENVQRQVLAVLHKLVDKCEQTTTKNVTTNNQIEVHGAINGNVVINNEGKE